MYNSTIGFGSIKSYQPYEFLILYNDCNTFLEKLHNVVYRYTDQLE